MNLYYVRIFTVKPKKFEGEFVCAAEAGEQATVIQKAIKDAGIDMSNRRVFARQIANRPQVREAA